MIHSLLGSASSFAYQAFTLFYPGGGGTTFISCSANLKVCIKSYLLLLNSRQHQVYDHRAIMHQVIYFKSIPVSSEILQFR